MKRSSTVPNYLNKNSDKAIENQSMYKRRNNNGKKKKERKKVEEKKIVKHQVFLV